ncbi:hypothetical protein Tco_1348226 [Tanacetum coccineum]
MLQSPPVRRALSSRLRLQHLKKGRVQRKDSDISSGIGLHVPKYTQLLAENFGGVTDRVVIGIQALSVALDICHGRVEKMERNLVERLPFLKDVFVSIDDPLSAEALIEPPVEVPVTNYGPSVSVEDYENLDLVDVVPKNVTLGPGGEENTDASTGGDLVFSKLDDEARVTVL